MKAQLFALCVMGICSSSDAVAFGSQNGYDVGGSESVCWQSMLDSTTTNLGIDEMEDELFGKQKDANLLKSCPDGTHLDVTPQVGTDRVVLTGQPYDFEIELTVDSSTLDTSSGSIQLGANGTAQTFFRIQLCDVVQQGFCSPMSFDSRELWTETPPKETDLGSDVEVAPEKGRWKYEEGTTLIGLPVDNDRLVFTRWAAWKIVELDDNSSEFSCNFTLSMQLNDVPPGAYFFLGHVVVHFESNDQIVRLDVANAVPENVLTVRDPVTIQTVSDSMKLGIYVATSIFGGFALLMFLFVVVYREHPVIKLAQGSFLAAIAFACLIQIAFSFAFIGESDLFCELSGPLVFIPMTFVGACLVGRIWRVYSAISMVQRFGKEKSNHIGDWFMAILSCVAGLPFLCSDQKSGRPRKSLRQTVTAKECVALITFLTLPQAGLQLAFSGWGRDLQEEIDVDLNVGRYVCGASYDWVVPASIGYVAFVYLVAVVVAWISRDLPSAFNEKDQIFHAATISTLLAFVSISLIGILNDASTEPDVLVFLRCLLSIGIAASVLTLIIVPKVRRVLSGEKIVVSNLLNARYSMSSSESKTMTEAPAPVVNLPPQKSQRSVFQPDEPLPKQVERNLVFVQNSVRRITEKMLEGRALTSDELIRLRTQVNQLTAELDLVDFSEKESEVEQVEYHL